MKTLNFTVKIQKNTDTTEINSEASRLCPVTMSISCMKDRQEEEKLWSLCGDLTSLLQKPLLMSIVDTFASRLAELVHEVSMQGLEKSSCESTETSN